jgi:hypothetical protein
MRRHPETSGERRDRDALGRAALLLAFLLGAGGSVALKLAGVPPLWAALWPIAVLAAYVGASVLTRAAAIEPEAVGDNCYYLGFLFTLASLATTLYQIRDLGAAEGASVIPEVISGFGVALSSTIAGVFGRVMLMQMRPDVAARDLEARRDLQVGAREFRAAISAASRGLKSAAVEGAQHAAEREAEIRRLSDAHAAAMAEAAERALALAQRLAEESEAAAARLREASERLASAMEAAAERPAPAPWHARPMAGLAEEPAAFDAPEPAHAEPLRATRP